MKVGVAYVNVCILGYLQEELAWPVDTWMASVISNTMLFITVIPLRI